MTDTALEIWIGSNRSIDLFSESEESLIAKIRRLPSDIRRRGAPIDFDSIATALAATEVSKNVKGAMSQSCHFSVCGVKCSLEYYCASSNIFELRFEDGEL